MAANTPRFPNRRNLHIWLSIFVFILAIGVRLLAGARTIDDSYITYRYVRNILAGNGFVYNPGEHVLGTTTPLYTLILVVFGVFMGGVEAPFPEIALTINAILDGVTCLLLLGLGKRLNKPLAGAAVALAWAIAPYSVTFSIGGLETSMYVLLLIGVFSAHIHNRHNLTALLASLAFLTRPDALILIGLIGLDRLWQIFVQKNRDLIKIGVEALFFLLPTLSWIGFATVYFGSPLPHSVVAKSMAYLLPPLAAFIRLLQHYSTPFMGQITFGVLWIYIGVVLYPFLFLIGAWQIIRENRRAWPLAAYPWLYLIAFSVTNPLIFRWYLTPPLPFYMFGILTGSAHIIQQLVNPITGKRVQQEKLSHQAFQSKKMKTLLPKLIALLLVVCVPFALLSNDWVLRPDHGIQRPAPSMAWYKLELLYRQAAEIINIRIIPGSTGQIYLAAGDVGVLGYHTNTRILDTVGLNSPQTIKYYPLDPEIYYNAYAIPPDLIMDEKPDYIVILEVYGRGGLLKDQRFLIEYTLLEKIPTDIYESDGMLIFSRKANQ